MRLRSHFPFLFILVIPVWIAWKYVPQPQMEVSRVNQVPVTPAMGQSTHQTLPEPVTANPLSVTDAQRPHDTVIPSTPAPSLDLELNHLTHSQLPDVPVETPGTPDALPAIPLGTPLVPIYNRGSTNTAAIAITFDDGPHPTLTPLLLDELKKRHLKATFFVLGDRVAKYPWIAKRILDEGHELGNHSYTHRELRKLTPEQVEQEVMGTQKAIQKATGTEAHLFRPPYGAIRADSKVFLNELNMKMILWSVDPQDWKATNTKQMVYDHIMSHTKNGDILLFHDIKKNTIEEIPKILDQLVEEGFKFKTVSDLCGLEATQIAKHQPSNNHPFKAIP